MEKGYIHIYKGEGKGKTSIINGMTIRALGADKKVAYVRFLKNRPTSENKILEKLGVEIKSFYKSSTKFVWEMNSDEVKIFKEETLLGFEYLKSLLQSDIDIIFVDEILGAVENGFIDKEELVIALIKRKPNIEVALSGRYSFTELEEIADLISEVKPNKHYFNEKTVARKGIEF